MIKPGGLCGALHTLRSQERWRNDNGRTILRCYDHALEKGFATAFRQHSRENARVNLPTTWILLAVLIGQSGVGMRMRGVSLFWSVSAFLAREQKEHAARFPWGASFV